MFLLSMTVIHFNLTTCMEMHKRLLYSAHNEICALVKSIKNWST